MSDVDYCELCDLPKSTCIHGNPPPPPPPAAKRTTAPPRTPGTRRTTAAPPPPPRVVNTRWTPPVAFEQVILEVLDEHDGQMDQDDLFVALEEAMADRLKPADQETTPEGELRWRYAARKARQTMITDGRMTKGKPGIWSLA
jgi:hypothetical protein